MLLKATDVPLYVREDSITTGYRQNLSYKGCLNSWFWLHNETVNIWSHFLGFLFFLYFLVRILLCPPTNVQSHFELLPIIIQLISYQFCMLSSSLFHTFSCHSENAHKSWLQFDHFGIFFALFGTYISFICDTFTCHPGWKTLHLSVVVFIFAVIGYLRYSPTLDSSPRTTKIQLFFFVAMGMYALIPFAHWACLEGGLSSLAVQNKLNAMMVPYGIAGIGLCFYVSHFPEKVFNTGQVDVFGASHQVWHVFVFVGMVYWYLESAHTLFSRACSPLHIVDDVDIPKLLLNSTTAALSLVKGIF
ncbi:hypothetical protein TCAL_11192 [Tigriopus californicus]|uniref:Uncharacterized protein n=1 Tax=Tigriopus californicus TaxID=6832 RepID=A0A553PPG4_TIGCA|nr:progestin and adipoQ receptor family member 3-like [Tigriopus californicus]TRY79575.1 hypothetical protein TCAL_11192 [Tigriopus californicus]|eukprot:TCALIF_11192-PA protein Name:"Similar to Paqr3 Progestin and adipoQ receptor family member 3 (Mus musculus)" AED:0.00 eAED:0.00 QI:264/1/1/1/0.2/0.5/6/363/302